VDLGLLVQTVDELARRGRTPLVVAFDGEAVAVLGIADTPRESARQAMGSLELLQLDIHIASGDASPAVQWLAEAIGLDKRVARGDLSPEQKKALVEELRSEGPTLVAGASAVDAEALAAADLAVAASTAPAVEAAAGALLVRQDPQGVVELIRAGQATRRGRALATAAGIAGNGAAMALAATGGIGVAGAAILGLCASLLSLGAAASPWVRIR
jgi:P-type E1-E2 ATPase